MEEPVYHLKNAVLGRDALEDFNGPLDLILQLLTKKKMTIADIRITDILEQYLAWMAEMQRLDLEIASEFVAMASYLLYIKSRMLLSATDEEAVDEMALLIRSLEERQRKEVGAKVRLAAGWLGQRDTYGWFLFPKPPEPLSGKRPYAVRHSPMDLLRAFDALLERSARKLPPSASAFAGIVESEPFPVTLKSAQLLQQLLITGHSSMEALLSDCGSRTEMVAAFLALLELCRLGSVSFQPEDGGDVEITFLRMPEAEMV